MEKKRKISVRKVLQLLLTVVVAVGCLVAMISASRIEGDMPLKSLPVVHIKNDRKYQFIEQKEIMNLAVYNRGVDILNTPVSKLDVHGIEKAIKSDPWVADAQVFVDVDRVMHMYVTQRVPVARLFKQDGASYYLDSTLHAMPLSDNYTYYTTVVTNAPDMHSDSAGMVLKAKIVKMVRSLQADKFWNAQVSQVIIDSVGSFEFVPVLGNQRIRFGDTTNTAEKLANLVVFYKNVLNRIGWDKYEVLDVRFNNQVVASPSLPYAGPKDMAVKKMNWISSIEMTEAQKLREDSMRRQQQIVEKANASVLKKVSKVVPVAAAPEPKQKTDLKNTAKSEVKKVETKKTIAKPAVSKPNIKTPSPKSDAAKSTAAKDKPKAKEEAKPAKADVKAKPPVAKPDSKNKENKKDKNKEDKNKAKPKDKPKTNKKADTKKEETKKTKDKKSEKKPEKEKTTDKKAAAAKYTYPQ
jgi:cell division protein FtsQ